MYRAYGELLDDVPFGVEGFGDGVGDDSGVAKSDNEILDGQDLIVSCWLRTRIESAVFITVKGGSCVDGEDDACSLGARDKGCDGCMLLLLLLSTHRIRSSTTIFGRQIPCLFASRLSTQPSRPKVRDWSIPA